ncbi:metal-dependent hydrolase [Thalassolituus sp. LLYu03]|uniref:metal-dependent hydrolase n=1 Tax=Thalassolituus sp. LLYu03 TaxID=3421656 RepID=UPI003D2B3FE0
MTAQVTSPAAVSHTPAGVDIKPRKMEFPFSNIQDPFVFAGNSLLTVFFGALSSTFPPGEAEFIASVRNYRDRVTDPLLKEQIRGFIGQEGHHSHQHKRANEVLRDLGIDAVRLEKHLERDLKRFHTRKFATDKLRLAMTVGMEHMTAIMAEFVLNNPEVLEPLEKSVRDLLYWHAVEEIEHKAVAFDVFMAMEGDQKYLRRVLRFVTWMFSIRISCYMVALLFWARRMPKWREIKGFWRFMFGAKGMLTNIRQPYRDYFKPGFHPWDHDNRELISKWQQELAGV